MQRLKGKEREEDGGWDEKEYVLRKIRVCGG